MSISPIENSTGIGTQIQSALALVGITSDRVSKWIGKPCGCPERIEKLNTLSRWASRIARGAVENAEKYLNQLMEE